MYSFLISIPFWIWLILFIFVLGICIYSYRDIKAKHNDNPMVWIIPFLILIFVAFMAHKYSIEFTNHSQFQQISYTSTIVAFVLFFLSFIITFIIAHKKNYTDKNLVKNVLPVIIVSFCIAIASLVVLFILNKYV